MTEKEALEFRVPWGKNAGLRFYDLGTNSTRWYAENARDPKVREAAEIALGWMTRMDTDNADERDFDGLERDWGDL